MVNTLWLCLAAFSGFSGMVWLALAMDEHWQNVALLKRDIVLSHSFSFVLRVLGVVALFVSLLVCMIVDRLSMAVLVWIMLLAASAVSVGFALAWRPHWLRYWFFYGDNLVTNKSS